MDLSVRVPRDQFPTWRDWQLSAVFGNKVVPENGTLVFLVKTEREYEISVAFATHATGERRLVYQKMREEPLEHINFGLASEWVHSSLADELQESFKMGSAIYLRALFICMNS